jgi:RNA polymerase sigma factor (sigma-70 family)
MAVNRRLSQDYGPVAGPDCAGLRLRAHFDIPIPRAPVDLMWSVSDDALLAGLGTGDPEAAAAFVGRFQRRVYGLALTIVGEARAAEDVAQEAFVRAWRHAGAFDPRRGTVVTWLLTITRNLAIDSVRVRRPVAVDPATILDLDLAGAERLPDELVALRDDADRLVAAMARLSPEQRRALVLAGLLGHTAREVSEHEGIPLGTAKTRIRTGLLRLRAALVSEERAE